MRRLFLSALFCFLITITVRADPAVILPSGELAFNTSFLTGGFLICTRCSGSGTNSVVFTSGENSLRVTFIGFDNSAVVGGTAVPTRMGEFRVVASGSGFVFPTNDPNVPLLQLNLQVEQFSPTAGHRVRTFLSGPGGGTSLGFAPFLSDYIAFPTGPNPPGFGFTHIVYTFSGFTIPNTDAVVDLNAELVAVPEPATLLLFGSGLGMTFSLVRKRFSLSRRKAPKARREGSAADAQRG